LKVAENISFPEKIAQVGTEKEIKTSIIKPYKDILDNLNEVYIFGAKELGKKFYQSFLAAGVKVMGFIDNNPDKQNTEYCGCKIIGINELADRKDEITIVIASLNYLFEISSQLKALGFTKVISGPVFYIYNDNIYKAEPAFDGIVKDLTENKQKYIDLYNFLEDEKSKTVLNAIIDYRLSFDNSIYHSIKDESQYFDETIIKFENNSIFIDGGGFDGDTSLKFIDKTNNKYKKILFFEPDKVSFLKAKENLKNFENIEFYEKGLYSKASTFKFNSLGGLGSNIDDNGNITIQVAAIDEILDEKANYIKMDVEGAELEALKGAKKQLEQGAQLAISLYHKSRDIWEIPEYIKKINPEYKFFVRHYTNTIFETVLYAVI
jgi:FkbM family methyltransferase